MRAFGIILSFLIFHGVALATEGPEPRNIYDVLNHADENFVQNIFGFTVPANNLPRVRLPHGYIIHEVIAPWSVRGELIQVVGLADANRVAQLLGFAEKGLRPVLIAGKAVVNLYLLNYADSNAGAYEESVIGYVAYREGENIPEFATLEDYLSEKLSYGAKIVNYVDHLSLGGPKEEFLNFQTAIWAGRVAISYPKFYGRVNLAIEETSVAASIAQPEVPYFNTESKDAPKAGSFILDIRAPILNAAEMVSYSDSVFFDFHTAPTSGKKFCTMGNHIAASVAELNVSPEAIQFSITGSSESAINLAAVGFTPQKIFHGKDVSIYMFQERSPENDCHGEGRPYDHNLFYPADLH